MQMRLLVVIVIPSLVLLGACGRETAGGANNNAAQIKETAEAVLTPHIYAENLYEQKCAICHNGSMAEAPTKASLQRIDSNTILTAMTSGVMREQSRGISSFDKEILANYLGAAASDAKRRAANVPLCEGELRFSDKVSWNRWGGDKKNTRFRQSADAGVTAENVSRLKLKWAFGFPGAARARSQPAVTPEAIFTGSQDGTVYALDTQTGCVWWRFFAEAEVRVAPIIATREDGRPETLYFGDFNANVYAIDAQTGEELWRVSVQDHPVGTITGTPTLHEGRLYVPLSSIEVVSAYNPDYACCTFRGGVIALDAATGARAWRFYTVPEPEETHTNANGVPAYGPSGVPVWSPPTIDEKRGVLYVGTGENYSSPATALSDAILSIDLSKGDLVWARQTVSGDAWNGACGSSHVNCPEENGPDFDFGAPPILTTSSDGGDFILAGQKSGMVYALDPDDEGRILWSQRAGMGGFNGGVHWGMASDGETVFVGIADTPGHTQAEGPPRQGVHAYDVKTGAPVWSALEKAFCDGPERRCQTAMSAAVTASEGVVFSGALNGLLRAYSAETGDVLWTFDTHTDFKTVNDVEAVGGSIDSDGPVIADGMVIVNSGYDKFGNIPGNVLLVFEVQ